MGTHRDISSRSSACIIHQVKGRNKGGLLSLLKGQVIALYLLLSVSGDTRRVQEIGTTRILYHTLISY